ncbi:MAG TPA: CPBP family intramembrane glutamic endopeptidase [Acidimicrobiales bacterium]|nr:CPBP family intramembrane glutamic endopeptidase [Acidimicrobiales bacterium]
MSERSRTAGALALAAACFGATFRGPRASFWNRMTGTGAALGGLSLLRESGLRRLRPRPRHMVEGALVAGGLYGVFRVGDVLARRIMPDGAGDIEDIYSLRHGQNDLAIATRLATVIGPAEELFWRGHLQGRLAAHRGRWPGAALAAVAYGGVHVSSGNPTLVGAASVAGAWWSALAALGVDMESLIVSHILWDIVIFLVAPTTPAAS